MRRAGLKILEGLHNGVEAGLEILGFWAGIGIVICAVGTMLYILLTVLLT